MKPRATQLDSNKRLAAYLLTGVCAYFMEKASAPPHGWQIVLLVVGLIGQMAIIYRAFIDGTDAEAKAKERGEAGAVSLTADSSTEGSIAEESHEQPADS